MNVFTTCDMQVSRPQVHSASGHLCRACIRMMGTARRKAGPSLIYICSKERDAVERRRARAAHTATSHCAAAPSLAPRSTDIQQAQRTAAGLVAYEELCTGLAPRPSPAHAHSSPTQHFPPWTPVHAHTSLAKSTTNPGARPLQPCTSYHQHLGPTTRVG